MLTSKQIAERINIFYNLLFHLDDYIKNKKERKGQLHLSKNIRLVLREIISSKINVNYFLNKEEIDLHNNNKNKLYQKKTAHTYIKKIKPLSFNQKNLNTINLFYNSNNEAYVINYLSVDKIFSIIKFCLVQIMNQKNKEFISNFEQKNKNSLALFKIGEDNLIYNANKDILLNNKNLLLTSKRFNNNISNKEKFGKTVFSKYIRNNRLLESNENKAIDSVVNVPSLIHSNYNYSIYNSSINNKKLNINKNNSSSLKNIRNNLNNFNDNISNLNSTKAKTNRLFSNKCLQKIASLPLLKESKNEKFHFNIRNKIIRNELINKSKKCEILKDNKLKFINKNNLFNDWKLNTFNKKDILFKNLLKTKNVCGNKRISYKNISPLNKEKKYNN